MQCFRLLVGRALLGFSVPLLLIHSANAALINCSLVISNFVFSFSNESQQNITAEAFNRLISVDNSMNDANTINSYQ